LAALTKVLIRHTTTKNKDTRKGAETQRIRKEKFEVSILDLLQKKRLTEMELSLKRKDFFCGSSPAAAGWARPLEFFFAMPSRLGDFA